MNKLPTIAIIGPGKVGTSIGILSVRAGYTVVAVGGRSKDSSTKAARRIGKNVHAYDMTSTAQSADMTFLCLPDDAIEEVCKKLARQNKFVEGSIVVHCSGAFSSDILSVAREHCSCSVASMHPLQTFPTIEAAIKMMKGTYCFYEGDLSAIPVIKRFATSIGLIPIQIAGASKALYHAAAVVACNYLIALMDSAIVLAGKAGIDRTTAWLALRPLVTTTLSNITEMGTICSLSGPISRGDVKTIRRHLKGLSLTQSNLDSVYRTMGLYTVEMAIKNGYITTPKAKEITNLLSGSDE